MKQALKNREPSSCTWLSENPENRQKAPADAMQWWPQTFTQNEIGVIDALFRPMGSITAESMAKSSDPKQVATLAGYLKKDECRHLGYRLLDRADTLVSDSCAIVSLHFFFSARGDFYYRWRDVDQGALDEAVDSYRRQVGLASNAVVHLQTEVDGENFVPGHAGYKQLRIIEEKRGNLMLARELCIQAKAEGWSDDWDKHIGRLDRKISRETLKTADRVSNKGAK